MSRRRLIDLGTKPDGTRFDVDLDALLLSNLLVQANTGGGKSYLLRRIAEQTFGKVPIFIIDPEGEFASLREKFDFVLIGPGGEAVPDVRSAEVLAHRLLKLGVSAVFDLSELKPPVRHLWVKAFLEALIEAPKDLWTDVLVIVDEAHIYMPEARKKEKPSPASDSMVDLASRGQKRGRFSFFATQRLAKLGKDGAAELQNVLVGPTFLDLDLDRACDALSVPKRDQAALKAQLKVMEPGSFFALGRALSKERVLVRVGEVETTHPERGQRRRRARRRPPPPSAKIKHLLPQLADLPQEAETKAATEADLRRKIVELEREVRAAKSATPAPAPAPAPKTVEVSVLAKADLQRLERAIDKLVNLNDTGAATVLADAVVSLSEILNAFDKVRDRRAQAQQTVVSSLGTLVAVLRGTASAPVKGQSLVSVPTPQPASVVRPSPPVPPRPTNGHTAEPGDSVMPEAARKFLTACAQFPDGLTTKKAALLAGYQHAGSSMRGAMSYLRKMFYVEDCPGDIIKSTAAGLKALGSWTPLPTGKALRDYWLKELAECPSRLLQIHLDAYPNPVTQEQLEEKSAEGGRKRYTAGGSSMRGGMADLRKLELVFDSLAGTTASADLIVE